MTPIEEKSRYDLHNNTFEDKRYVTYMESIIAKVKKYISGTVLDYGCGEGKMLEKLLGAESYDIFYAPKFPETTFDTVICIETVEHFIEPLVEFEKLVSTVTPGGTLIIKTEFYRNQGKDWYYLRDETHRSFYSVETMKKLAKLFRLTVQFVDESSIIVLKKEA